MSDYQAVTVLTISGAVVFGMVLALLGSIKLSLARQFDLSGKRVVGLLAAFNLALIPLTLVSGYLVDCWSARVVLLLGSLVTSGAVFAMSRAPSYRGALWAVLMAGFGAAALSTASIKLMPHAFFPSERMAQGISLGHVFIALGALATPALADVLVHHLDFRRAVAILAFLCLVPAFLCALPAFGGAVHNVVGPTSTTVTLFAADNFWKLVLAGLVFFFYAPLEGSITVWATTYLTDLGHGERRATWVLTGFWAMLLVARLLTAFIPFTYRWYPWLIVVPALLTLVVLGNLAGSADRAAPRTGLLWLGFLLGPIFPILIGVVFESFKDEQGLAYGCVFAMGSLGGLMLTPLVSPRTRAGEVKGPFRVPMALALALTVVALVFGLTVGGGVEETGKRPPRSHPEQHHSR